MDAFLYTRKSRALGDPDDDPYILAHQREALLRLAAQQGFSVPEQHIIEEIGSGETLSARPRFAALLSRWRQEPPPPGTPLLVTSIDRLGRGEEHEMEPIITTIRRAGIRIVTPGQTFDLSVSNDKLVYRVLSAFSAHMLDRNKEDVRLRKEQLLRDGERVTGGRCFGYEWDRNAVPGARRGRLVPVPEEFALVQKLFREATTKSVKRLAAETGLPMANIRYILKNPVYTGYPAQHTRPVVTRSGRKSSRPLPPHLWRWPEKAGNYTPAVSLEQFNAVQEALLMRFSRREKTGSADGWCRDRLALDGALCHVVLGSEHWYGRNVPVYRLRAPGRAVTFAREPIHAAALGALRHAFSQPEWLAAALADYHATQAQAQAEEAGEAGRLTAELAAARRRLVALKLERADGEEDRLALQEAEGQVKRDIDSLKRRLAARRAEPAPASIPPELLTDLPDSFDTAWAAAPEEERRALVQLMLAAIHLRVEPRPKPLPAVREILSVEYDPWLAPHIPPLSPECDSTS